MKILTSLLLSLCLLSSSAFADVTLYGLTLGETTIEEAKQLYTLSSKNSVMVLPDSWSYFRVSGDQINLAHLKDLTVYFDDKQVLGKMMFIYPASAQTFNELDIALSNRYIKKLSPPFNPKWTTSMASFDAPNAEVKLEHDIYSTSLTITDNDYQLAADKERAKAKAAKAQ